MRTTSKIVFLIVLLLAAYTAFGQSSYPSSDQFSSISWLLQNPPLPVPSASVSLVGNPGPGTYYFWIVANYLIGNGQPSGPFLLTSAPNAFSASNYAQLNWMPAPGAFSYDILETTGNFPPTGVCNCAIATGQTGQAYNVTTNTLSAYTVTGVSPSDYTISAQDAQSAAGKSALTFTLPNGVVIGSLDSSGFLNVNGCNGCGSSPANFASPPPIGNITPNTIAATALTAATAAVSSIFTASDSRTANFPVMDLRDYNIVGDLLNLSGCSMTALSTMVTCSSASFTSADVGKGAAMSGANTAGAYLYSSIAAYVSPTQVNLTNAAIVSSSAASFWYGTNNTAAWCTAMNCNSATVPNKVFTPQPGRTVRLPRGAYGLWCSGFSTGTAPTINTRNGDRLRGDGNTVTEIAQFDCTGAADILALGSWNNAGVQTLDTGGLSNVVDGIHFISPQGTGNAVNLMGGSGIDVTNNWFTVANGVYANANIARITGNTADYLTASLAIIHGNGLQTNNPTHSILLSRNDCYATRYTCFTIDGAVDVDITNNVIDYAKYVGIGISSPTNQVSYRIHTVNNGFITSLSLTYYVPTQVHYADTTGCVDCTVQGNKFALTRTSDIQLGSANSTNNLISGNQHYGGQDSTCATSSGGHCASAIYVQAGGLTTIANEIFDHVAQNCLFAASQVKVSNSHCSSPYQINPPTGTAYLDGAFDVGGVTASGSIFRSNTTDSTVVGAVSASAGTTSLDTSNNRSAFNGCAVCVDASLTASYLSSNERSQNFASTGDALFLAKSDPVGGVTIIPGTTQLGSGPMQISSTCQPGTSVTIPAGFTFSMFCGSDGLFHFQTTTTNFTFEPSLGNPSVSGYVLSSTTAGARSWVANGAGGGGNLNNSGTPTQHQVGVFVDATHLAGFGVGATGTAIGGNTGADPSFQSISAILGYTPTNAAVMPSTAPGPGYIPIGNVGGTAYAPQPVSGNVTFSSTGGVIVTGIQSLSSDPATPAAASAWLNTSLNRFSFSNVANQLGRVALAGDFDAVMLWSTNAALASIGQVAQSGTTPFSILVDGDSHFAGISATGEAILTPLRNKLGKGLNVGPGFVTPCGQGAGCTKHPYPPGITFTLGGTWLYDNLGTNTSSIFGLDDSDIYNTAAGSGTITLQCNSCNDLWLNFKNLTGNGSGTCTIDGAATGACSGTINTGTSGTAALLTVDTGNIGVTGNHTIVFTVTSGTIHYGNGGAKTNKGGTVINNVAMGSAQVSDNLSPFTNFPTVANAQVAQLAPNLIIIGATGSNECIAAVSVATFAANLHTLYTTLKSAASATNPAFLFATGPDELASSGCTTLAAYSEAIRQEAWKDGWPTVDLFQRYSPLTAVQNMLDNGSCYAGTSSSLAPHLNNQCGDAAADVFVPFILPSQEEHPARGAALDMGDGMILEDCKNPVVGAPALYGAVITINNTGLCSKPTTAQFDLPIFVCESNCGAGSLTYAKICTHGKCPATFDGTSTYGDFVVLSQTVAGAFTDTGSNVEPVPGSGCEWVVGQTAEIGPSGGGLGKVDVSRGHRVCAAGSGLPSLAPGDIWVGNGSSVATPVAPSGDLSMSNAGVFTVTKTNGTLFGSLATLSTVTSANVDSSICSNAACGQSTTGTAANLTAAAALPNGTTAPTQSVGTNNGDLATTQYVDSDTNTPKKKYSIPQSVTMTASTNTNIGSVSMLTPGADGNYLLYATLSSTAVGSGGTCSAGGLALRVGYTDRDSGAAVVSAAGTSNFQIINITNSTATASATFTSSLASFRATPVPIAAKAGVAIVLYWDEATASNCTAPPVVNIRPALWYQGN